MALTFNLLPWIAGGLAILIGLVCDAVLLARFTPAPTLRIQRKAWGLHELAQATTVIFGLLVLSNVAYAVVAHVTRKDFEALAPLIIPVELVLRIAALLGFAIFFKRRRIAFAASFGLLSAELNVSRSFAPAAPKAAVIDWSLRELAIAEANSSPAVFPAAAAAPPLPPPPDPMLLIATSAAS